MNKTIISKSLIEKLILILLLNFFFSVFEMSCALRKGEAY
jgi:hypothetical protein